MTYREMAEHIDRLSEADKDRTAEVVPPGNCPHVEAVPVTELRVTVHAEKNVVVFLTGKEPQGE